MSTDDLIERLSAENKPAPRRLAAKRLALGAGLGAAVATLLMWHWLGVRPDLTKAALSGPFWMKFAYTLAVALSMFWLLERLSRPGARTLVQSVAGAAPPLVLGLLAAGQLLAAEQADWRPLMMGGSADICPWRIVILASPILAGELWALRGLAPTRPGLTGLVAGLLAGGAGAFIYAFHCDESAMPFVALWYSCGILVTGAIGGLLGRWLLRW